MQYVFVFKSGFKSLWTDRGVLDILILEQVVVQTETMTCSCLVKYV
jgi:hypothetical protein